MSGVRGRRRPVGGGKRRGFDKNVCNDGIYANARLTHAATCLVGLNVQVSVKNGGLYDGILKTFSPKMDICLEQAHKLDIDNPQSNHNAIPTRDRLIDKVIFNLKDIVMISAANVDLDYVNKDTFVDTAISSKHNGQPTVEKELKPWDGEQGSIGDELQNVGNGNDSSNGWDADTMFKRNEEIYKVTTSYDPNLSQYTTPLVKQDTKEWKDREETASRIAREIESSENYRKSLALENGEGDEEMQFSAVHRPEDNVGSTGGPGKYVPPHLRNKQQGRPTRSTPPTSTSQAPTSTSPVNQTVSPPQEEKIQDVSPQEEKQEPHAVPNESSQSRSSQVAARATNNQSNATVSINDASVIDQQNYSEKKPLAAPSKGEPARKQKSLDATVQELKEFSVNFKLNKEKKEGSSPSSPQQPHPGSPQLQQVSPSPQTLTSSPLVNVQHSSPSHPSPVHPQVTSEPTTQVPQNPHSPLSPPVHHHHATPPNQLNPHHQATPTHQATPPHHQLTHHQTPPVHHQPPHHPITSPHQQTTPTHHQATPPHQQTTPTHQSNPSHHLSHPNTAVNQPNSSHQTTPTHISPAMHTSHPPPSQQPHLTQTHVQAHPSQMHPSQIPIHPSQIQTHPSQVQTIQSQVQLHQSHQVQPQIQQTQLTLRQPTLVPLARPVTTGSLPHQVAQTTQPPPAIPQQQAPPSSHHTEQQQQEVAVNQSIQPHTSPQNVDMSTDKKSDKQDTIKTNLNPLAKEFVPKSNTAPAPVPQPVATPPRPQSSTQSPVMTQQQPANAMAMAAGHQFYQTYPMNMIQPRFANKRGLVPSMMTLTRPDNQAGQLTGQPLFPTPGTSGHYIQMIMPQTRMVVPQTQQPTQQQQPQQQQAIQEPTTYNPQQQQATVYLNTGQQQIVPVAGSNHHPSHPTHAAPHHQATPPHSQPHLVSSQQGGGATVHPSPSPIHTQQQLPGGPPSSGTPQPYVPYQIPPNGNQPPLQPSPHTPTSPQYPQVPYNHVPNYISAQTQPPQQPQQQPPPQQQQQPPSSYTPAHHTTQVTHAHHQQHTHVAAQQQHQYIMMQTQHPQQQPTAAHVQYTHLPGQPAVLPQQAQPQVQVNPQAAAAAAAAHQPVQYAHQIQLNSQHLGFHQQQ